MKNFILPHPVHNSQLYLDDKKCFYSKAKSTWLLSVLKFWGHAQACVTSQNYRWERWGWEGRFFGGGGANMVTSSQKKKKKQSTNPFPHTLLIWHSSPFFDSSLYLRNIESYALCKGFFFFFFFFKQKMTKQSTSSFCYVLFCFSWSGLITFRTMPKRKKARFNHMWLNCSAISQTYGWPWLITMLNR